MTTKTDPFLQPAYRSVGAWVRYLIPAILGLAADQALKFWAFPDGVPPASPIAGIPAGRYPVGIVDPHVVLPHVLGMTTTINRGAVFGIGQGMVMFFLAFSLVALAIILWVFAASRARQWMVHISLGLITAGALGNLWDRAMYAGVRDMLIFYVRWYPYIYNIADVLLCIGVPLLMLTWFMMREESSSAKTVANN